MFSPIVNTINLFSSALLVGAMFCVWLVFNPARLDATQYTMLQQQGIRTLHPFMPRLGVLCILLSALSAIAAREDRPRMALLLIAAACFVISGLITRFGNMPINAMVIHWNIASPPAQWAELRDQWWRWHRMRLASGLIGLVMLVLATLSCNSLLQSASAFVDCRSFLNALMEALFLLI